jgi:hypothetical protein
MTDEELGSASHHQIERLCCGRAKIFASDCHHNIGILSNEAYDPLEACNKARSAFDHQIDCSPIVHPHRLALELVLSKLSITLMYSSRIRMKVMMAMSSEPKAMEPK